ncbi:tetratricopeptide repeat protein, partial [bacterium]|nr:tetratricopeptide repeat protein [bacterium]
MKKHLLVYLFCLLCLIAPGISRAQNGTMQSVMGAKAIALGGSLAGGCNDPSALFWNPAALNAVRSRQLYSYVNAPYSLGYTAFAEFVPRVGTFAVSISPEDSSLQLPKMMSFGWGGAINRTIATGVNYNLLRINDLYYATIGFGIEYTVPVNNTLSRRSDFFLEMCQSGQFRMGASANGIPLTRNDMEPQLRGSFSYEAFQQGLLFHMVIDAGNPKSAFHIGAGYRVTPHFAFMAGTENFEPDDYGLGFEFRAENFAFQAAYAVKTTAFHFGLHVNLGKTANQLSRHFEYLGREDIEARNFRSALRNYQNSISHVENDSLRRLVRYLEKQKARDDAQINSLHVDAMQFQLDRKYLPAALRYAQILQIDSEDALARENLAQISPFVNGKLSDYYEKARVAFAENEFRSAENYLKAILRIRPHNAKANTFLIQISDTLRAEAQMHYYQGWGYERQGLLDRACQTYEAGLRLNPEHTAMETRYQNLTARRTREAAQRKQQINTYLTKARQSEKNGNSVEAFQNYQAVLSIDGQNQSARLGWHRTETDVIQYTKQQFQRGERYFNQGRFKAARNSFQNVRSVDGINAGVERYVQQAENYLNRIQNQQQTVCAELYEQGINALELAEFQIALNSFEKMMQLGCREEAATRKYRETLSRIGVDSLRLVARQHLSRGELLMAKNTFQRVLQLSPDDSEALDGSQNCEVRIQAVSENHF